MDEQPAFRAPRDEDARAFYLAYLQSAGWRTKRNRALMLASYCCARCDSKRSLEVHHKTYARLGREWDQDLEVLCSRCHENHHDKADAKLSIRIYLKLAGELLWDEGVQSIGDLAEALKRKCVTLHIDYDADRIDRAVGIVCAKREFTGQAPQRYINLRPARSNEVFSKAEAHAIVWKLFEGNDQIKGMPEVASFVWKQTEDEYLK